MAMSGPMDWKARAYLSSLNQMRITAGHDSLLRKENVSGGASLLGEVHVLEISIFKYDKVLTAKFIIIFLVVPCCP